ncbi:MAG: PD-(D/E)XK motif protein [Nitrospirae bacterium]|nr:PD-(D/E)XK motif protein [Nitrospirota bacterium]
MKNNPWASIKRAGKGFDSERINPKNKFDFFWAVSKDGKYQFFIEHANLEDWPTRKITLAGIDIQQFQTSTGFRIALSLSELNDWDIFYILCNDLLQASDSSEEEKGMLSIVYNRLLRWQKLFRKLGKKLLSDAEQQGLIGELYFLKNHLLTEFSDTEVLSFWRGPYGEQQDFGLGNNAIEVKSKQGTSAPYIQISTIDQLDSQLANCFLYVVTLNSAPHNIAEAFSLNKIIEDIKDILIDPNDVDVFENLLSEVGYMDLPEYSEKNYLISNESVFEVEDGFPRLLAKDIPIGIDSVQYKIEIKECKPFAISIDDFKKRITGE